MKKLAAAFLFCLLFVSGASAQSIVGTWSIHLATERPYPYLGTVFVTFYPNGTFRKVTQLLNGQLHAEGHYQFDGHTLYYVVDNYGPKYIGTAPVSEPAYHHWLRESVEFDDNGSQMLLNGDYWIRHTQY